MDENIFLVGGNHFAKLSPLTWFRVQASTRPAARTWMLNQVQHDGLRCALDAHLPRFLRWVSMSRTMFASPSGSRPSRRATS
jgi:hypothetical protein